MEQDSAEKYDEKKLYHDGDGSDAAFNIFTYRDQVIRFDTKKCIEHMIHIYVNCTFRVL